MTSLTPEAVAQMVADLRDGVHSMGMHEDNNTELFDVEGAGDTMFAAADMLINIAAENATLRTYNTELCDNYNSQLVKLAHQDDELATLRASEAAAVERVQAALEIAKMRHIPDQPSSFGGSELEWAQRQYASLRRDIIAALTPPKTEGAAS